jgi:hypothetical protein
MKTFRITFEELNEVYIEAETLKQARNMFYDGEYDRTEHLATNMIDIEEHEE